MAKMPLPGLVVVEESTTDNTSTTPIRWESAFTQSERGMPSVPPGCGWEPFAGGIASVGSQIVSHWVMWRRPRVGALDDESGVGPDGDAATDPAETSDEYA